MHKHIRKPRTKWWYGTPPVRYNDNCFSLFSLTPQLSCYLCEVLLCFSVILMKDKLNTINIINYVCETGDLDFLSELYKLGADITAR